MTIGLILLLIAGILVLLGVGQRVLDKLRLTDRQALFWMAMIAAGGFLPEIRLSDRFRFNIGGALIPLALSVYLWIRAGSARERARSLAAAVGVGAVVYALGRFMPNEPENIQIDPALMDGLAAGVIGYLFGRSRRGSYIAATVGVLGASVANAVYVWSQGIAQPLTLGGAGAFDVTVISGFLAVLLSELIGEIAERIVRGRRRPMREFKNGEFIEREESR